MSFLFDMYQGHERDPARVAQRFADYKQYLVSIRARIAPAAFDFADADWHYDFNDHQCPHDSWVESLVITENDTGALHEARSLALVVRLLGAYHDGHIELSYTGVKSYSLAMPPRPNLQPDAGHGHGDWLIDEVSLSSRGTIVHEVLFSHGGRWAIECEDIRYDWKPLQE